MENPYWYSQGQCHSVNLEEITQLCFDLMNIYYASKPLAKEFEDIELEEEQEQSLEDFPLLKLHQDNAFKRTSEIALRLAMMLRTYDDLMRDSEQAQKYAEHVLGVDDHSNIGDWEGRDSFPIREACNKLIHATEVRPLYQRIDRQLNTQNLEQDIWYLTGEIELKGLYKGKNWEVIIYFQPFIEAALNLISFGYPE